jgi:hypothetical protein
MVDIHSVIARHKSKKPSRFDKIVRSSDKLKPTTSEIPDLFFDEIVVEFKLSRMEIAVLMYLYRRVWCKPNLFKLHGISPLLSHQTMSEQTHLSIEEIYNSITKLESLGFLQTIRSGQYFVRRYFTHENDEQFKQSYDDFDI